MSAIVSGLQRRVAASSCGGREFRGAPPVRQPGQRILARELHQLLPVAAVGDEKVDEQRDDRDAGQHHHGIPAQLLCLAVRLLLR